jgi:uncharacterized protein
MVNPVFVESPDSALVPGGPVPQGLRIQSIDVLRGFAVLGILVMNIQSYSMIGSAYINPTAYGDLTGPNYAVWLLSHLFADMKFITLFSMLFGAGVVLMSGRRESATGRSAGVHYRRMGWLLLFGLLHAYLLWYGDILYSYALCGMLVYLFRNRRPGTLIVLGLAVVAVGSAIALFTHFSMPHWPPEALQDIQQAWSPAAEAVAQDTAAYRGGYLGQMAHRAEAAIFFQTFLFPVEFLWRAGGMMLVGMGLYKLGVFSAARSRAFYVTLIAAAVLFGLPVIFYGVRRNEAHNWDVRACMFQGTQFNYWGSILVSLGWVGVIMLVCQRGALGPLTRTLSAVGQMALTNYIMHSVICTLVFYGHGLGLYGKVERVGQIGIVLAIFVFQLLASPVWLGRFRFGPLEWLWRSLTYWKLQPMRRNLAE